MNHRRVLHGLFNFACARELAHDNPVARTERPKIIAKEPGILTPSQLGRLLEAADETLRPAIAISAFAGLRPAEVDRLNWEAVNLEERFISVSAQTSKTASRRLVPIPDNLLAWLMRSPSRMGSVVPVNERKLFLAARKAAGITKWPSDALRHSWVTYRFALTGNAAPSLPGSRYTCRGGKVVRNSSRRRGSKARHFRADARASVATRLNE
jgi:integrase